MTFVLYLLFLSCNLCRITLWIKKETAFTGSDLVSFSLVLIHGHLWSLVGWDIFVIVGLEFLVLPLDHALPHRRAGTGNLLALLRYNTLESKPFIKVIVKRPSLDRNKRRTVIHYSCMNPRPSVGWRKTRAFVFLSIHSFVLLN